MISYWKFKDAFTPDDRWTPDCWMRVTDINDEEKKRIVDQFGVPEIFFEYLEDGDERARYDTEDGWSLIVIRMPFAKSHQSRTPYITIPLGIIFKDDIFLTLCNSRIALIDDFIDYHCRRNCGFVDYVDLIFQFFLVSSVYYLKYLRQIGLKIEQSKRDMDGSIDNNSIIALSRLQDSLTYFETSIHGNQSLLSKVRTKLPIDKLDSDLIEDVVIELEQACETAQIYSTILDSTMDTYSSIINNNVNGVMRVLASVSIILMLPTLIASFLGMNLINGMEGHWWGLPLILLCSAVVTFGCWLIFHRKRLI